MQVLMCKTSSWSGALSASAILQIHMMNIFVQVQRGYHLLESLVTGNSPIKYDGVAPKNGPKYRLGSVRKRPTENLDDLYSMVSEN